MNAEYHYAWLEMIREKGTGFRKDPCSNPQKDTARCSIQGKVLPLGRWAAIGQARRGNGREWSILLTEFED